MGDIVKANGITRGKLINANGLVIGRYNGLSTSQDPLKTTLSMYGDSVTDGSFNVPNASSIWVPNQTNSLMAADPSKTSVTGDNIFDAANIAAAGVVTDGTTHTLTASAGEHNPRLLGLDEAEVVSGEFWLITATFDTTTSVGPQTALRIFIDNPATPGISGADINVEGWDTSTSGDVSVQYVISADRAAAAYTGTATRLRVGAEIIASGEDVVAVVKNISLKKCTQGVDVVNQGTNGWLASDGVTNIADVTTLAPDRCVLAFGTNDIRTPSIALETYLSQIASMANTCKANQIIPIIAMLTALDTDQINYELVPAWNIALKALAATLDIEYWDRWAIMDDGNLIYIEDGRHPSRAGYTLLAEDAATNSIMTGVN